jgi:hypothetical protein
MPVQAKEYLKSKFETGDVPNGQDFADLIDTMGTGNSTVPINVYTMEEVDAALATKAPISGTPNTTQMLLALAQKIDLVQMGIANGVATLGADGKLESSQMVPVDMTGKADRDYVDNAVNSRIDMAQKGVPNGVATLGIDGKVPAIQLAVDMSAKADKTYVDAQIAAEVAARTNSDSSLAITQVNQSQLSIGLAAKVDTAKIGVASGVASLDASGKIPAAQIPSADVTGAIPVAQKGMANGVATLGTDAKIMPNQLPSFKSGAFCNITTSTQPPTGVTGADGDIWIQYIIN